MIEQVAVVEDKVHTLVLKASAASRPSGRESNNVEGEQTEDLRKPGRISFN
jgi:hypothetical protein